MAATWRANTNRCSCIVLHTTRLRAHRRGPCTRGQTSQTTLLSRTSDVAPPAVDRGPGTNDAEKYQAQEDGFARLFVMSVCGNKRRAVAFDLQSTPASLFCMHEMHRGFRSSYGCTFNLDSPPGAHMVRSDSLVTLTNVQVSSVPGKHIAGRRTGQRTHLTAHHHTRRYRREQQRLEFSAAPPTDHPSISGVQPKEKDGETYRLITLRIILVRV